MQRYLILPLLLLSLLAQAQQREERAAVVGTIQQLFEGMRTADSALIARAFHPEARLQTTLRMRDSSYRPAAVPIDAFVRNMANRAPGSVEEKIWRYDVNIDGGVATAWTPYSFYNGGKLNHCGHNAFQLIKSASGWQILQITDTRRKTGCQTSPDDLQIHLDTLLDNWHQAAATADEEAFFGRMTEDAVYIGTDANERWKRDELREWASAAFDRPSAWAFEKKQRTITVDDDGETAWWDETLDTWMGVCRGSGVLRRGVDGWRIKHYVLSITVPNDKVEGLVQLLQGKG